MINTSVNQTNTKTQIKPKNDRRQPFLVMDNVYKEYPNGYRALENINLNVAEGEFITLIGHSGCGKSTLLNMVSGFSHPSQGTVTMNGQRITKPGPDRMVVFQGYALLPWRTVFENVYLAVNSVFPNKSKVEKNAIVKDHLAMVGLTEAAEKRPPQISGGMKQRVSIARALAIRPKVLILDEPFGALDAITHDIDEALFLADRLVMMTNGPSATIGEVLEIPFPRPRDRVQMMEDPEYYNLRNYALDFL